MLRVLPNVADEELLLDNADQQIANQGGSAIDTVNDAKDWTWEAVVKEAGNIDDVDEVGN